MLFSLHFQTLLLPVCSFFATFFCPCLLPPADVATPKRLLLHLLNTFYSLYQSIPNQSVSFPPILYVIFLCSFFSNHVFATRNSFSSQNSSSLFPSTFLSLNPCSPWTPSKSSIRHPTCPLESQRLRIISPAFCKFHALPHFIIKLELLAV